MRPYPTQTPLLKTRGVTLATTQVSNRLQSHFWWPIHAFSKRPLQRTGRKRSTEPPRVPVVSILRITERTPIHSPRGLVLQLTHISLPGKGCWDLRPVTDQERVAEVSNQPCCKEQPCRQEVQDALSMAVPFPVSLLQLWILGAKKRATWPCLWDPEAVHFLLTKFSHLLSDLGLYPQWLCLPTFQAAFLCYLKSKAFLTALGQIFLENLEGVNIKFPGR